MKKVWQAQWQDILMNRPLFGLVCFSNGYPPPLKGFDGNDAGLAKSNANEGACLINKIGQAKSGGPQNQNHV